MFNIRLIIAEYLGLPICGVNLPNHFVLAYVDDTNIKGEIGTWGKYIATDDVLFYINPFSKGKIFGSREIDEFLEQWKLPPKKEYYLPCNNPAIIRRMLNNLCYAYDQQGAEEKMEELKELIAMIDQK